MAVPMSGENNGYAPRDSNCADPVCPTGAKTLPSRGCERETCGIRTFGLGGGAPAFYVVALPSFDDVDREELVTAPLKYVDGRHVRTDCPPADTRLT